MKLRTVIKGKPEKSHRTFTHHTWSEELKDLLRRVYPTMENDEILQLPEFKDLGLTKKALANKASLLGLRKTQIVLEADSNIINQYITFDDDKSPRYKEPRNIKRFSEQEIVIIKSLHENSVPNKDIANYLHRPISSITNKIKQLYQ